MISEEEIKKAAIKNAAMHNGEARLGSVISEILGKDKQLVKEMNDLKALAEKAVNNVNSLPKEEIMKLAADMKLISSKENEKEKRELKPLPGTENGVVLRLPPEPSGYMHWGHALSFTINYLYKEMYNGKLWLRFEDTNPNLVKEEFVKNFEESIKWLGIKYDEKKFISDDMEKIYGFAEKLIEGGKAYGCTCSSDEIKQNRNLGKECQHRNNSVEENASLWEKAKKGKFETGELTFRFKGDMNDKDASLRDPNIMRVIKTDYKPYNLWPLYDFASVIEDELCGITHILRSNEFKASLQTRLRKELGFHEPYVIQYSRFNFEGTLTSKRKVRELIKQGYIKDWHDIRLATIYSMKRRGIEPEAIREFVKEVGYSSSEHEYSLEMLFTFNRRIIDGHAKRLFFVPNPIKLLVQDAIEEKARLPFHPSNDLGYREIQTNGRFFVDKQDVASLDIGETFRLKELYSVEIMDKENDLITCRMHSREHEQGEKIIQWVTEQNVPVKVIKVGDLLNTDGTFNEKSLTEIEGFAEKTIDEIEEGQVVQFERFGFCRLDSKNGKEFIFVSK
ncbi:glutamate--tRNA ligase [Candidatus Parvarchaeota archaeon]|nr:glutamate--tRNA ligase [Candidatus Parvarchaeota archaeon]